MSLFSKQFTIGVLNVFQGVGLCPFMALSLNATSMTPLLLSFDTGRSSWGFDSDAHCAFEPVQEHSTSDKCNPKAETY